MRRVAARDIASSSRTPLTRYAMSISSSLMVATTAPRWGRQDQQPLLGELADGLPHGGPADVERQCRLDLAHPAAGGRAADRIASRTASRTWSRRTRGVIAGSPPRAAGRAPSRSSMRRDPSAVMPAGYPLTATDADCIRSANRRAGHRQVIRRPGEEEAIVRTVARSRRMPIGLTVVSMSALLAFGGTGSAASPSAEPSQAPPLRACLSPARPSTSSSRRITRTGMRRWRRLSRPRPARPSTTSTSRSTGCRRSSPPSLPPTTTASTWSGRRSPSRPAFAGSLYADISSKLDPAVLADLVATVRSADGGVRRAHRRHVGHLRLEQGRSTSRRAWTPTSRRRPSMSCSPSAMRCSR